MCKRTNEAINAAQRAINGQGTSEAFSKQLGVNSAHVYKLLELGKLSPTLDAALVRAGHLEPREKNVGIFIRCREVETQQLFQQRRDEAGVTSEQYLKWMMEVTNVQQ